MYAINCVCLIGLMLTLSACVPSHNSVQEYVAEVKKNAHSKMEPVPPVKKIAPVDYTAENMRSPFTLTGGAYTAVQEMVTGPGGELIKQSPRPDLDRPREYLEQFPLSSLAMVGVLSNPETSWGLVRDGNGMIHAIKIGDYLGLNSGKVIAITPNEIKINETVPNGNGGWMDSKAALALVEAAPAAPPAVEMAAKPQKGASTDNKAGSAQKPAVQTATPVTQQQPTRSRAAGGGR